MLNVFRSTCFPQSPACIELGSRRRRCGERRKSTAVPDVSRFVCFVYLNWMRWYFYVFLSRLMHSFVVFALLTPKILRATNKLFSFLSLLIYNSAHFGGAEAPKIEMKVKTSPRQFIKRATKSMFNAEVDYLMMIGVIRWRLPLLSRLDKSAFWETYRKQPRWDERQFRRCCRENWKLREIENENRLILPLKT